MAHLSLLRLLPGHENSFDASLRDVICIVLQKQSMEATMTSYRTWDAIAQIYLKQAYSADDFYSFERGYQFSFRKFVEKLHAQNYNLSMLLRDLKRHRPSFDYASLQVRLEAEEQLFKNKATTMIPPSPTSLPPVLPVPPVESLDDDRRAQQQEEEELRQAEERVKQRHAAVAERAERLRRLEEEEKTLEEKERKLLEQEQARARAKTLNWELTEAASTTSKITDAEQCEIACVLQKRSTLHRSSGMKIWEAIASDFLQREFLEDDFTRNQRFDYSSFIRKMTFHRYHLRMLFNDLVKHDPDYKAPVAYRNAL